jgi:hypothetical protein
VTGRRGEGAARVKANNGHVLPTDKLEQRKAALVIYRDMARAAACMIWLVS